MIGKIVGAMVGRGVAKNVRGMGGTTGALLGAGAPFLLRRMSPLGLAAAAAGGYALKRMNRRKP